MAQSEFSHPLWSAQGKKKPKIKISESFLNSLKSNRYWMALGGGTWVELFCM